MVSRYHRIQCQSASRGYVSNVDTRIAVTGWIWNGIIVTDSLTVFLIFLFDEKRLVRLRVNNEMHGKGFNSHQTGISNVDALASIDKLKMFRISSHR